MIHRPGAGQEWKCTNNEAQNATQYATKCEKWEMEGPELGGSGWGRSGSVTVNGTKRNESQEMSQNTKNNKRFAGGTTFNLEPAQWRGCCAPKWQFTKCCNNLRKASADLWAGKQREGARERGKGRWYLYRMERVPGNVAGTSWNGQPGERVENTCPAPDKAPARWPWIRNKANAKQIALHYTVKVQRNVIKMWVNVRFTCLSIVNVVKGYSKNISQKSVWLTVKLQLTFT